MVGQVRDTMACIKEEEMNITIIISSQNKLAKLFSRKEEKKNSNWSKATLLQNRYIFLKSAWESSDINTQEPPIIWTEHEVFSHGLPVGSQKVLSKQDYLVKRISLSEIHTSDLMFFFASNNVIHSLASWKRSDMPKAWWDKDKSYLWTIVEIV